MKKNILFLKGKTPEGRKVFGGIFAFYETMGVPLDDIFFQLWNFEESVPDWIALINDMTKAGRPHNRSLEAVETAINDACYPEDFKKGIIVELTKYNW
jgi:hypothetical protein